MLSLDVERWSCAVSFESLPSYLAAVRCVATHMSSHSPNEKTGTRGHPCLSASRTKPLCPTKTSTSFPQLLEENISACAVVEKRNGGKRKQDSGTPLYRSPTYLPPGHQGHCAPARQDALNARLADLSRAHPLDHVSHHGHEVRHEIGQEDRRAVKGPRVGDSHEARRVGNDAMRMKSPNGFLTAAFPSSALAVVLLGPDILSPPLLVGDDAELKVGNDEAISGGGGGGKEKDRAGQKRAEQNRAREVDNIKCTSLSLRSSPRL